jgi:[acyl-carrier-protein] S-malonyltransferase
VKIAYLIDGGLSDVAGAGLDLYEKYPQIKDLYAQAAEWTGVTVDRMLRWELPRHPEYLEVGLIRQASIILGVTDLLADRGVRPDVIAGMSLGSLVGACIAGAVDRRDLFTFLRRKTQVPPPTGPEQACAGVLVPVGLDDEEYLGKLVEGTYVAGELGVRRNGTVRGFMVAGYREALQRVMDTLPEGAMHLIPDVSIAVHTPLCADQNDFLEPVVSRMTFRDPVVPLCSCKERGMLTTGKEVGDWYLGNQVDKVSTPDMFHNVARKEPDIAFLLGPARLDVYLDSLPCPVIQIEDDEQLADAMSAIYELRF